MQLTPKAIIALKLFKHHGQMKPQEFAQRFFDQNSDGWRHRTKCGPSGVTIGGGMRLSAGGYLGRLAKAGWLKRNCDSYGQAIYSLTSHGLEVLARKVAKDNEPTP